MKTPIHHPGIVFSSFLLLACMPGLSTVVRAAESGIIAGEVFDAETKQSLAGARVSIGDGALETSTDTDGRFRLTNVPTGQQLIRVNYLGADKHQEPVMVGPGEARPISIALQVTVVKLAPFVVSSFAGPQIHALNEQRRNDRLTNIVSADSLGNMPDIDMRSALNRMPGVNVTGEKGEISIRGAEGKLNALVMDGASIVQAPSQLAGLGDSGATRAFDMQLIPAETAQSIELIKTLTPDLDATAVGGIVNIRTGSAFNSRQRTLSVTPTYLWWDFGGSGEQVQIFFRDVLNQSRTWGIVVNATYRRYDRVYGETQGRYENEADAIDPAAVPILRLSGPERKEEDVVGFTFNGSLDWKASETTRISLKPYYNWRVKDESTKRAAIQLDNITLTSPDGSSASGRGARVQKVDRFRPDREFDQLKMTLSSETDLPDGKLEALVSMARSDFSATQYQSTFRYPVANPFRRNLDWTFQRSDPYFPVFDIRTQGVAGVPNGTDVFSDHARYEWPVFDMAEYDNTAGSIEAKVDWTRQWAFDRPVSTKVGAKWFRNTRENWNPSIRYGGATGGLISVPAGTVGFTPFSIFDGRFQYIGDVQNTEDFVKYFHENPQQFSFDPESELDRSANNFDDTEENTYAAYAMATVDLTSTLRLLGGVRVEKFKGEYGWTPSRVPAEIRGSFAVRDIYRGTSYTDYFPSASIVYRPDERKVIRLGYSTSIARPDYIDVIPRDNRLLENFIDPDSLAAGDWEVGNPDLKAARSDNLDLSAEWYYGDGNYISASVFRKTIDDFIFSASHPTNIEAVDRFGDPVVSGGQPQYVTISRPENGGKRELKGYELSWQHRFSRLPSPLDGLGTVVNYSNIRGQQDRQLYTDRENPFTITGFARDPRTQDQPRQILSSQLYWEKYGFQIRGSYTWTDRQVSNFDDAGLSDRIRAPLRFLDASLAYTFRNGWKAFVTVRNLTEEYEDYRYYERPEFMRVYNEDGRSWTSGLRMTF